MKQVHVNHRKSNLISFVLVVWRAAEETTNEKTRRMMMSNCRGDLKLMLEEKLGGSAERWQINKRAEEGEFCGIPVEMVFI